MRNINNNESDNLIFLLDILFTVIAFLFSFWARNFIIQSTIPVDLFSHLFILPLLIVLITSFLTYFGAYGNPARTKLSNYFASIIKATVIRRPDVLPEPEYVDPMQQLSR